MPGAPQITPVAVSFGSHLTDPAPFCASFTGRGGGSPTQVHVLLTSDGPEPEARCQAVLASLRRRLANLGQTSLTTTLNGAFQACHQELSTAGGGGVGLTIVAVRGDDVYLAAVADIAVFQLDRAGVRRVRPSVPGTMAAALGVLPEVTPAMERLDMQPGEAVLVCDSAVTGAANMDGMEAVLSSTPRAAADRLASLMNNAPLFLGLIITAPSA